MATMDNADARTDAESRYPMSDDLETVEVGDVIAAELSNGHEITATVGEKHLIGGTDLAIYFEQVDDGRIREDSNAHSGGILLWGTGDYDYVRVISLWRVTDEGRERIAGVTIGDPPAEGSRVRFTGHDFAGNSRIIDAKITAVTDDGDVFRFAGDAVTGHFQRRSAEAYTGQFDLAVETVAFPDDGDDSTEEAV